MTRRKNPEAATKEAKMQEALSGIQSKRYTSAYHATFLVIGDSVVTVKVGQVINMELNGYIDVSILQLGKKLMINVDLLMMSMTVILRETDSIIVYRIVLFRLFNLSLVSTNPTLNVGVFEKGDDSRDSASHDDASESNTKDRMVVSLHRSA